MEFSPELRAECESLIQDYPRPAGALLPILNVVQNTLGHISPDAVEEVAQLLGSAPARVWEVVDFYAAFRTHIAGRCRIQVCRTLPCRLVGAEDVLACLREYLGIGPGQVTDDGRFEIEGIDCIGACATAPVMLVEGKLHQSLTREYIAHLLETL
ncbi:MAG: NADH-quinone oxidoreductase subunit NuoE family protein [Candidatus Latescibacterota bacterium]|jgi:NADH-quinone oxidoreductase subunit E